VIDRMFDKDRVRKSGRKGEDLDQAFMYAMNKLQERGKTDVDVLMLMRRLEQNVDAIDVIIEKVYWNLAIGQSLDSGVSSGIPIRSVSSIDEISKQSFDQRIASTMKKILLLHDEANIREEFNLRSEHKARPVLGLRFERNKSIRRLVNLFKEMRVYFLTEADMHRRIEESEKTSGAEQIIKDIWAEHNKRLAYDSYVKKVYKCKEAPKYLYVYFTGVENQLIGDRNGPLLRVVEVPTEGSISFCKDWPEPDYKPVSSSFFHQFEVDIRDETGCPVSFNSGPLIVTVHFTPVVRR
jgi:hypothetical protein